MEEKAQKWRGCDLLWGINEELTIQNVIQIKNATES